jgi:hypothetical protein
MMSQKAIISVLAEIGKIVKIYNFLPTSKKLNFVLKFVMMFLLSTYEIWKLLISNKKNLMRW